MLLRKWDALPENMKTPEVRKYYNIIARKRNSLAVKRGFDILMSVIAIVLLSPVMLVLAVMIKCDSKGPVIFRQTRVTQYGRKFKIWKFRTMVNHADRIGSQVTTQNDARITKVGQKLRRCRLDEIPQLFNIFRGDMTFVGTRPEVPKYVKAYSAEMWGTLLLPAGVTSEASIKYKDEDRLMKNAVNADETYINEVLPGKMVYNLESIRKFGLLRELKTMFSTLMIFFD